jgi:phage tail protein X
MRIRVPEPFAARRLRERQDAVDALAASFFGRATRVVIEENAPAAAAANAGAAAQSDAARQRRKEALEDPAVGRALEILGADIVEIRPLGGGH